MLCAWLGDASRTRPSTPASADVSRRRQRVDDDAADMMPLLFRCATSDMDGCARRDAHTREGEPIAPWYRRYVCIGARETPINAERRIRARSVTTQNGQESSRVRCCSDAALSMSANQNSCEAT